jgi:hypothetical protein
MGQRYKGDQQPSWSLARLRQFILPQAHAVRDAGSHAKAKVSETASSKPAERQGAQSPGRKPARIERSGRDAQRSQKTGARGAATVTISKSVGRAMPGSPHQGGEQRQGPPSRHWRHEATSEGLFITTRSKTQHKNGWAGGTECQGQSQKCPKNHSPKMAGGERGARRAVIGFWGQLSSRCEARMGFSQPLLLNSKGDRNGSEVLRAVD